MSNSRPLPPIDLADVARMAANLARHCGYRVFPCRADKTPATPHGFKDSSKDPAMVTELWRRYPGPLIGIATGALSGIDCFDIDVKHQSARLWWQTKSQQIPPTRTYKTQSGGLHCFFKHADGVRNSEGKICKGVDVRGCGGYCINWFAAGAACLDNTPPAEWPQWLLKGVLPPPKPANPASQCVPEGDPDSRVDAVCRLVATAGKGQRNSLLFWAACRFAERIRDRRMGSTAAERLLVDAARAAGLSDQEARRTVRSAMRAVPA